MTTKWCGLAIAHHIREQVTFKEEPINIFPEFNFEVERVGTDDFGGKIEVI